MLRGELHFPQKVCKPIGVISCSGIVVRSFIEGDLSKERSKKFLTMRYIGC